MPPDPIDIAELRRLNAESGSESFIDHYSIHGDPSIWIAYKGSRWFKVCDMGTDGDRYGRTRTELFVKAVNALPALLDRLAGRKKAIRIWAEDESNYRQRPLARPSSPTKPDPGTLPEGFSPR